MSERSSNIFMKIAKVAFWVFISLVVIVAGLRLSLNTKPVHQFVKNKIESIAGESLTAGFSIKQLSGDLWTEIHLSGVFIGDKDTVAYVDTLYADYDILSLINGTFDVNEVLLSGGKVNIKQTGTDRDSSAIFNVQQIIKADTAKQSSESTFAFNLNQVSLQKTEINIYSPDLLPDSSLQIRDIDLTGSLAFAEEIEAGLQNLGFRIYEGKLPEPITFRTAGNYQNEIVTLEDLVLNTGRSVFNAKGTFNLQDTVTDSDFSFRPLSSSDIEAYINQELPDEDLKITLGAKGGKEKLQLELSANSRNIRNVEATATLSFEKEPVLEQFGIRGDGMNIAALTNDSIDVQAGLFQATMDGTLSQNFEKSDITWGFTIEGIRYEDYNFKRFFGSGSLKNSKVLANLDITTNGEEKLTSNITVNDIFYDKTSWEIGALLHNFNAKYWAKDAPDTDINLNLIASGKGVNLNDNFWNYRISNVDLQPRFQNFDINYKRYKERSEKNPIKIGNEQLEVVLINGKVNQDSVFTEGFIELSESRVLFNAAVSEFMSDLPYFRYNITADNFDVQELNVIEDFPTDLTFNASGKGKGLNLQNLFLEGNLEVDSSFVNGSKIDMLKAEYVVQDGVLDIPDANLRSEIANADFSGHRNIMDKTDPENILSFDLQIKNTQPFAELADLEILQIQGDLSAEVKENEDGYLQCFAKFDLNNIVVDDLFLADGIKGNTNVVMAEKEEGELVFTIDSPKIYETQFQDISFKTKSVRAQDSLNGNYSIELQDSDNGRITSSGDYEMNTDSVHLKLVMQQLDLITSESELTLQKEFTVNYGDGIVNTDSLELTSPNGAFLSLAVPYADSLNQQIWLVGESFDFGIIQEIVLEERYVDGVLFGRFNIDKSPDSLSGNGNLELQNLEYEGVQADIFNLQFDVSNNRLTSNLSLLWDNEEIISGNVDIPFDLSNPEELSDEFFNQQVSGSLKIAPTPLSRFKSALDAFDVTGTEGLISFDGSLSGTAGSPDFKGLLTISDPVISEIPLDSIYTDFSFSQNEEKLIINTEVLAANQKAADIKIDFPFSYNFKTFELNTVDENRPVSAVVKTTDFNLAVFNDFLDKEYTRDLKGKLNGNLDLKGTENRITANGSFKLEKSSFEVPVAGIKVDGINSEIQFSDDKISLVNLKANSGKGSFTANGIINLDGITPTNMDISAKANQFKLANNDEYNLVVDLNSNLSGSVTAPTATGRFAVKNGFVVLDNFGDKAVEDVQLEGEETENVSYYDSLSIDMEFAIERNFFVRNRRYLDMEVEITGELDAQKEKNGELSLFGSLEGTGGYLRPLGKRFDLEEAELAFSGPPDNPDINVKSEYVPQSRKGGQEVTIYYLVKGTAEEPQFSFESEPQMEQQDIICYTLFNRPCYALESWQGALTSSGGSSPTDLLTGVLLDEIEALATRELGIDVVQIDNTRVGNETGTSIKTGWYLNEKTFFAIVNEITSSDPKTLFILEYALSNTWDLIITEGEDSNRRGVDFRWQYDY